MTPTRSLRRFLVVGSAAFVVGAAVTVAGFVLLFSTMRRDFEREARASAVEQRAADEIVSSVYGQLLAAHRQLQRPRGTGRERFDSLGQVAYTRLREYLFQPMALDSRMQVETIKELHESLEVESHLALDLIARGEVAAARAHVDEMESLAARLEAEVGRFGALRERERAQLRDAQVSRLRRWVAGLAVLVVVLVAYALLFLREANRRVVRPLAQLSEAATQLGGGDLSVRVPPQRYVELAMVAASFNAMAGRVQAAHTEIETQNRELRASEARFRGLLEAAPDAMVIVDRAGRIQLLNAQAERMFGYARGELLGQVVEVLVPRGLQAAHRDCCSGFFENSRARPMGAGADLTARRKGGGEFPVEISLSPLETDQGLVITAAIRDVSERRQLQRRFLQAQKAEAIGQLAAGVAHDFNNLLTVITGYGALLLDETAGPEDRRTSTAEILRAAERASVLTRQLLAFGRRQVLHPRPLDLNEVVTSLEHMLRGVVSERTQLVLWLAPDLGTVSADAGQVEQVIVNLVVNARDAMPDGGTLTIVTANVDASGDVEASETGTHPGPSVMLAVCDTGTGMDEATASRIFEPFFTTKEVGRGTGLGLSAVQGIVRQSGGQITVESAPARGTTVRVFLPRVAARPVTQPAPEALAELLRGSERILVVEDNDAVRAITARMLKRLGYAVTEAHDGEHALTLAAGLSEPPDLLVTDMVMPRVTGRELAEVLRRRWPALPVLFVSGYSADAVAHDEALVSGAAFLGKPFTQAEFAAKVRAMLNARVTPA